MKTCVSCTKELPDTALHCVFCGTKQPAPVAALGQTMLGYIGGAEAAGANRNPEAEADNRATDAADSSDSRDAADGPGRQPSDGPPANAPHQSQDRLWAAPSAPTAVQGEIAAAHPPINDDAAARASQTTLVAPLPPGVSSTSAASQRTIIAQPTGPAPDAAASPGASSQHLAQHELQGPPPAQPPLASSAAPAGPTTQTIIAGTGGTLAYSPANAGAHGPPPPVSYSDSQAQALPPSEPPYLASQTAARLNAPIDPWEQTLRTVMLALGATLLATAVLPWSFVPTVQFAFTGFSGEAMPAKVLPLLLLGSGGLAVVISLLPLATLGRGIIALLIAMGPLMYLGPAETTSWQSLLGVLGVAAVTIGLIARSVYRDHLAPRLLVSAGAVLVLLGLLLPAEGGVSLLERIEALGATPGSHKLDAFLGLLPAVLAVLSLLVWMPPSSSGAGVPLAWAWIFLGLVVAVLHVALATAPGAVLAERFGATILLPLAQAAWLGLTAYGGATIVGKTLEHA